MVEKCALACEVVACEKEKEKEGVGVLAMVDFSSIKKVAALHVILPVRYLEKWSVRLGFSSRRWSSADCLKGQ